MCEATFRHPSHINTHNAAITCAYTHSKDLPTFLPHLHATLSSNPVFLAPMHPKLTPTLPAAPTHPHHCRTARRRPFPRRLQHFSTLPAPPSATASCGSETLAPPAALTNCCRRRLQIHPGMHLHLRSFRHPTCFRRKVVAPVPPTWAWAWVWECGRQAPALLTYLLPCLPRVGAPRRVSAPVAGGTGPARPAATLPLSPPFPPIEQLSLKCAWKAWWPPAAALRTCLAHGPGGSSAQPRRAECAHCHVLMCRSSMRRCKQ